MQLSDCYNLFGGDYEAVKQRLSKEELIEKFVLKFLTEPSFENLCSNIEAENPPEAFRAAHSLKGVCQNLGFDRLSVSSGELTEYLRGKETVDWEQCRILLEEVNRDYNEVIEAIHRYELESKGFA